MVLPTAGSVDPLFDHLNNVALSEGNNGIEPGDDVTQSLSSNSASGGTTIDFEVHLLYFNIFIIRFH